MTIQNVNLLSNTKVYYSCAVFCLLQEKYNGLESSDLARQHADLKLHSVPSYWNHNSGSGIKLIT